MNKKNDFSFDRTFDHISGMCQCTERAGKEQFTLKSLSSIQQSDYSCQCKSITFGWKVLTATGLARIKLKLKY